MPEGFLTNKMLLVSSQCSSQRAEKGHGTVPSLILPPRWPRLWGRGSQARMFFFQPRKMIKGSVVGTQRDGSQGSIWELENLDNTKVTSISFNKSTNKPLKPPKNTGYIITTLCFSWMGHVTEQTTAASSKGQGVLCCCRKITILLWL